MTNLKFNLDFDKPFESFVKRLFKRHTTNDQPLYEGITFLIVYAIIKTLKELIEDPEEEITWNESLVEIQYLVDVNFSALPDVDIPQRKTWNDIQSIEIDLEKIFSEKLTGAQRTVLTELSVHTTLLHIPRPHINLDSYVLLLDKPFLEKVPEKDRKDVLREIEHRTLRYEHPSMDVPNPIYALSIPIDVYIGNANSQNPDITIYFVINFEPLIINKEKRLAYYPITVKLVFCKGIALEREFIEPIPLSHSDKQNFWDSILSSLEERSQRDLIPQRLFKPIDRTTFAIPSHPLMFALFAIFAGKPNKIPRQLLEKPYRERTPKEQKKADEFLNSILDTDTRITYNSEGKEEKEERRIALISDNPKVEAKAEISDTLFSSNLSFREEALAIYIKRAFGAEGLRHLLGLIIGLEENFRQGHFEWTINEHLTRLGYKKHHKGGFSSDLKKTATEIVKIFTSLFITAHRKDGKGREQIQGERLFNIDGFKIDIFNKEIINERIKLRATDFWYKNAFEPTDEKAPKYTKLLKKIAKENHRNHPLTIYLAALFAIFWRMSPKQKLSIKSLMDWCNLDINGHNRMQDLRDLEAELNYMKNNDYLGNWTNNGEQALPSECGEPFKSVVTLTPPDWLREEIKEIGSKKDKFFLYSKQGKVAPLITREEFMRLLNNSGLTTNQFANHLGISRQMVSYIKNGRRNISPKLNNKIRDVFDHMLPV